MSWFRVDDTLHAHRKARRAGHEALGLWVVCGSYASSQVATGDGFLASDEVESIAASIGCRKKWEPLARKLVEVGLWEAADGGYFFHDWAHYRDGGDAELARRRENDRKRKKGSYVPKSLRGTSAEISAEKTGGSPSSSAESNGDVSAISPHPPVPSRPVHQIPPTPQGAGAPVDEIPEAPSPSAAWLRAIRLAKAPGFVLPKSGLPAGLVAALEQDWADSDGDWPAYCAAMAADVGEWVRETVAANRTAFAGGWKWTVFAGWRAERDAKQASGSARSPATAVYVPVDTSDAVPPPEGFLEALKGIGGPVLNRGRA